MSSALNVYVSEIGDDRQAITVRLIGEVDIATAPVLRGELLRLLNRCQRPVVLDLSQLAFIDSTGLGALIAGYTRARQLDCAFCLAAPSRGAARCST